MVNSSDSNVGGQTHFFGPGPIYLDGNCHIRIIFSLCETSVSLTFIVSPPIYVPPVVDRSLDFVAVPRSETRSIHNEFECPGIGLMKNVSTTLDQFVWGTVHSSFRYASGKATAVNDSD